MIDEESKGKNSDPPGGEVALDRGQSLLSAIALLQSVIDKEAKGDSSDSPGGSWGRSLLSTIACIAVGD